MEQLSVFSFLFLLLWDPFLFFGEFFVLAGWGGGDYGDPLLLILSVDDILGFLRHHGFVMPFFFFLEMRCGISLYYYLRLFIVFVLVLFFFAFMC
jgi:hypothetical protein